MVVSELPMMAHIVTVSISMFPEGLGGWANISSAGTDTSEKKS